MKVFEEVPTLASARSGADPGNGKMDVAAIKIDAGIPLPPRRRGGGRPWKWPFAQMEIGDSFATALKAGESSSQSMRRVDYLYAGRRLGWKYTGRCLVENGNPVLRIWRIA